MQAPTVAETPENAPQAAPKAPAAFPPRQCPECGEFFTPTSYQNAFCSTPHKIAYQNRLLSEGRAVVTLAKAWRLSRNRKADRAFGAQCLNELVSILDGFNAADREAGRAPASVQARALLNSGTRYIDRSRPKK